VDEPLLSHQDVTTIMSAIARIQEDVQRIRELLEEDDGEDDERP
jgi:hypothetical protein